MNELPNLAKTATADLVETIGGGSFKASYINWSRTLNLLREHAPGWMPELVRAADGGVLHAAPQGAFLLIRFRHLDGTVTPEVPQAIMDAHNKALPMDKITARDVTDTHRRGVCLAAAFTFGLAYELWAKMPLESGYADEQQTAEVVALPKGKPQDGMRMQDFPVDRQLDIGAWANSIKDAFNSGDTAAAAKLWHECDLPKEEKAAVWFELESHTRTSLKKFMEKAA